MICPFTVMLFTGDVPAVAFVQSKVARPRAVFAPSSWVLERSALGSEKAAVDFSSVLGPTILCVQPPGGNVPLSKSMHA